MNHSADDFEARLQRQPPREVPAHWRREIVTAAVQAAAARPAPGWVELVRGLLWPSPVAWGGLAAVWLVILGVHLGSSPGEPEAAHSTITTPQLRLVLEQQQRLLAELRENEAAATPAKPPPRPRSRSDSGCLTFT